MSAAETTSLSSLSDGEWSALSNRWARGIDWCVSKVGKKWAAFEAFGRFPLFKTKRAAYQAVTTLVTWEARCRAARNPDAKTNADLGLCPCKCHCGPGCDHKVCPCEECSWGRPGVEPVTNPKAVRSVCRGCGKAGDVQVHQPGTPLVGIRPGWCTCAPNRGGPYEAPKGYVAKFTFGGGS